MNKNVSKYLFYYPATFLRGERVIKYLSDYEAFQWKPAEEIELYQLTRLKILLQHAYEKIDFYRSSFDKLGIGLPKIDNLQDLNKLPLLTKADVVGSAEKLVTKNHSLFTTNKTTGGSTGQAVTIRKNADALARERAATWRAYHWAGIGIGDPQARFWGIPLHTTTKLFYSAVDFIANRRRLSAFDINKNSMQRYYKEILKFKPSYFYGYASMIAEFSRFVKDYQYPIPPSLKCIITTSEVLDDTTRSLIQSTFKCRVFNEYGCGEVGSIAHECEYGNMHVMADNLILEILGEDGRMSDAGEIVVTDLYNYAMPLIRYRLGDFASVSDKRCACGRGFPIIKKIHGRAYDMIADPDGNKYHPEIIMYIFEELKDSQSGISQFQVVQKTKSLIEVVIVPSKQYKKSTEQLIANRIHEKVHPGLEIRFVYSDTIQREKSGKLRLIKNSSLTETTN